jgi:hypothetical protein
MPKMRCVPGTSTSTRVPRNAPMADAMCCTADSSDWYRARSRSLGTRAESVVAAMLRPDYATMNSDTIASAGSSKRLNRKPLLITESRANVPPMAIVRLP